MLEFPASFHLSDGTHVLVKKLGDDYEFHLTRLNSEKHNFFLKQGRIEESYETRFDKLQQEAVIKFEKLMGGKS